MAFLLLPWHGVAQDKKETPEVMTGIASWYSDSFNGKRTASGEIFSQKKFTCASNKFRIGSWLRVINIRNGKSVIVKVNDRMSPRMRRIVDLTSAAAKKIGLTHQGLAKVRVEYLGRKKPLILE